MTSLARLVVGLPAAVLLPACVPLICRSWSLRVGLAGVLALIVCGSGGLTWRECGLVGAVMISQFVIDRGFPYVAFASAGAIAVAAAVGSDRHETGQALRFLINDDRLTIIIAMGAVTTFVAGALIASLLAPLTQAVKTSIEEVGADQQEESLVGAGRYIGWVERTVVYSVVLLGRPEGIVLVLTAKSFARFPSFKNEAFGEYFLLGTLISLLIAAAMAIGTRVILGAAPL